MTKFNKLIKERKAQGMTEYIIIVALIAVASIAVVSLFGNTLRDLFGASAEAISGASKAKVTGITVGDSDKKKNLSNFGDDLHKN